VRLKYLTTQEGSLSVSARGPTRMRRSSS
jgi:hypothetical protein